MKAILFIVIAIYVSFCATLYLASYVQGVNQDTVQVGPPVPTVDNDESSTAAPPSRAKGSRTVNVTPVKTAPKKRIRIAPPSSVAPQPNYIL